MNGYWARHIIIGCSEPGEYHSEKMESWKGDFESQHKKNTTMSNLQEICCMASIECSYYTHVMPCIKVIIVHIYIIYIKLPQNGNLQI